MELWEPLTEEELRFSWHCLVDQGQLTVASLQQFMLDVAGEELSNVQARDLLSYLDATGDGRVGMDEFRHFMSATELHDVQPQTFLWSPTKSYREKHGLMRVGSGGEPSISADRRESVTNEGRNSPEDPLAAFGELFAEPTPYSEGVEQPATTSSPVRTPQAKKQLDEKALSKISSCIARYESQTWDRLHAEQEAIRRKLFSQWSQNSASMSSKEYHKMLMKMHNLARSSMPGELKPGDTVATLQHMLDQSKPKGERSARSDEKAGDAAAMPESGEELVLPFATWAHCMAKKEGKADATDSKAKTKQ
ncbi:hypothetical protein AK812_SmicGene17849 [Symbiodinium microadriaticum]|uniref:EF-hand domain-containing protein n=1 Tax=Symbiodinium microadriaticum TaxID=2951 RepID=A0A1Q9DWR6_SYMMI|nr:hypothetical protein AK812_SmicGene17849 [Symbiodinium microadriaticum]